MTPLTKAIVETDWSKMYQHLYEQYYPIRLDKSQTFPRWLEDNVKIEYFSPAMLVRTGNFESESRKKSNTYNYPLERRTVRYWALMNDLDSCEIDESDYITPLSHLNGDDWKQRETDLDHF